MIVKNLNHPEAQSPRGNFQQPLTPVLMANEVD